MIAAALMESVDSVIADRLHSKEQQELVLAQLVTAFASLPKKAGIPDLAARLTRMEERMRKLAESVQTGFVNGRLVVKVTGSSEALMQELRRGTDWYAPWDNVDAVLLAAVFAEPSK